MLEALRARRDARRGEGGGGWQSRCQALCWWTATTRRKPQGPLLPALQCEPRRAVQGVLLSSGRVSGSLFDERHPLGSRGVPRD